MSCRKTNRKVKIERTNANNILSNKGRNETDSLSADLLAKSSSYLKSGGKDSGRKFGEALGNMLKSLHRQAKELFQ